MAYNTGTEAMGAADNLEAYMIKRFYHQEFKTWYSSDDGGLSWYAEE